ncbi:hypothetical protein [Ruegeria sp. HKCCSP351]|uniref:hypothetical protein n=1 Tax=Ruegeria sp. HKCCSP351 TaxID=2794832 RepID=UPI001AE6A8A9|nr:hypothetical protein [Ruegeria sp. HKCCSP351]
MVKLVVTLNWFLSLNEPNHSRTYPKYVCETGVFQLGRYTMGCEAHHRQKVIVSGMKLIIAHREPLNRKGNNKREILLLFLIIFRNFATLTMGEHI